MNLNLKNLNAQTNDPTTLAQMEQTLATRDQGWLDMELLRNNLEQTKETLANKDYSNITDVVVIGIGGSMLGPKSIYNIIQPETNKRVHFVENVDPDLVVQIERQIKLETTLFLVQTKSGGTPETIACFSYFLELVNNAGLTPTDHFYVVTDPADGHLRQMINEEGYKGFDIAPNIGGRFSVVTAIGSLMSEILGVDFSQLLDGYESVLSDNGKKNKILEWAKMSHELYKNDKQNLVVMPYSTRLKTLAEWSVQLVSESLGKKVDNEGNEVWTGLTPVPAVGATDQHSQVQLFVEGKNDKQICFIEVEQFDNDPMIPAQNMNNDDKFGYFSGTTFSKLLNTEKLATEQTLTEYGKANMTIKIERINEYSLGELYASFMLYTAYKGELMNINTYDQPGVERGKVLTREFLGN